MKVLLQPASDKVAQDHFRDTVEIGVSLKSLRSKISENDYTKLRSLNQEKVKAWILRRKVNEGRTARKEWANLNEDDYVLFYAQKKFFYIGKVFLKIRKAELGEEWYGEDEKGYVWEFIYFLKEGKHIDVPYVPEILITEKGLPFNNRHKVFQTQLLSEENSSVIINHIKKIESILLDEDQIESTVDDEQRIIAESKKVRTPKEAAVKIRALSKEISSKQVEQRIRFAKVLARNPKFARLVKEKSNYVCEICGQKPFIQKDGLLYAEAHHKYELAKTLIDDPRDMICVCPTCHKVLHYGNKESLRKRQNTG